MAGFSNRDRLRKRLKAIPERVRKAAERQLEINANEMVETAKDFVPIDDGALVSSIKQRDASDETKISRRISAGSNEAFYASWVEFGHGRAAPRPFFWSAYRLKRRRFKARMNRAAKKAVQEATK